MTTDSVGPARLGEFVKVHDRYDWTGPFVRPPPIVRHPRGLKREKSLFDSSPWLRYQRSALPHLEDQFRSLSRMHDRAVTACAWALRQPGAGSGLPGRRTGLEAFVQARAAARDFAHRPAHEREALTAYRTAQAIFRDASRELFNDLLRSDWPPCKYRSNRTCMLRELATQLGGEHIVLRHLSADHYWTRDGKKTPYRVSLFFVLWYEPIALHAVMHMRGQGKRPAGEAQTLAAYRTARAEAGDARSAPPAAPAGLFRWVRRDAVRRSKTSPKRSH